MKRLVPAILATLLLPSAAFARSEFDPSIAALRLPKDALRTYDFETPEGLFGANLTTWTVNQSIGLEVSPITKASDVTSLLTNAEDAVEGAHAIRLGDAGVGFGIMDAALFAGLVKQQFEITLWARGDGGSPQLTVAYGKDPAELYAGDAPFATIRGVRTGRETTDGWIEYSTGPLDGSIWSVPVAAVLIAPSPFVQENATFLIDALEIRRVDVPITEAKACTQQNVDAVCGAQGDCMFGHCITSTATWGVIPSASQRRELAERWSVFATRFIGDRNALARAQQLLVPGASKLAEESTSSRQFFGGMNRLVNLLRDNHTSFGSPSNFSQFSPQIQSGSSSVLGACFGVIEKDIVGGGLGYGVFRATANPMTGMPLQRGDVLQAIDGMDPKQWVDEVWPRFATTMPNDPAADYAPSANDLGRLIGSRASTVTILRCASAAACDAGSRQEFTIDVGSTVFKVINGEFPANVSPSISCTQRFTNSVASAGSSGGGFGGEDPVFTAVGPVGETRVQFDGFMGQDKWNASMGAVFNPSPARVIMDTRMGHGGLYSAVQDLFDLVRGTNEPMGVISLGRGTYDLVDPPWLVSRLGICATQNGIPQQRGGSVNDFWTCFQGNANGFFARRTSPPGANTKIAWLNSYDVSANDFMPRLLQGRSNIRIFGPHATSGAFGAVSSLPSLWTGWSGGSMQVQDTRFSPTLPGIAEARWESGHGVKPDQFVAEKLSDAIAGVDTMLEVATAWLTAP